MQYLIYYLVCKLLVFPIIFITSGWVFVKLFWPFSEFFHLRFQCWSKPFIFQVIHVDPLWNRFFWQKIWRHYIGCRRRMFDADSISIYRVRFWPRSLTLSPILNGMLRSDQLFTPNFLKCLKAILDPQSLSWSRFEKFAPNLLIQHKY